MLAKFYLEMFNFKVDLSKVFSLLKILCISARLATQLVSPSRAVFSLLSLSALGHKISIFMQLSCRQKDN